MAILIDVHMPLIRDTLGVIECPNDTSGLLEFINVLWLAFTALPGGIWGVWGEIILKQEVWITRFKDTTAESRLWVSKLLHLLVQNLFEPC